MFARNNTNFIKKCVITTKWKQNYYVLLLSNYYQTDTVLEQISFIK